MRAWLMVLMLLVVGLAGCSTTANGVAPARQGWVYVVGSKQSRARVWLCPATPSAGSECREIDVMEVPK